MKWISVKDRLPNKLEGCLVWYNANLTKSHIRTATYLGNEHFSTSGIQDHKYNISHWQPLPKAPK